MKKLLPTLLPILGLAITAVSPDVQGAIAHFVAAHPALSGLFTVVSLIINHWLPSPGSSPSDSTIAKIGTASMLCIALVLMLGLVGCSPVEVQAYRAVVGAKAFTKSIATAHPECGTRDANDKFVSAHNPAGVCVALEKGIAAKDVLIDLAETYCAGSDFDTGGHCNPPTDKTVKNQLAAKITAAIQVYEQTETDVKTLIQ